ncbi:MAG: 2TM domain-containing protein [Pasteurellaceae bacterium]|nr:2TM domain-containing protein [Pasteurellaceae bacterium]
MLIQKLRLQRGWSQEQLAEISGLSVRTIQRLEKGQTGSLETLRALAAVFEIELSQLQQEQTMNEPQTMTVSEKQEREALTYAKRLRKFYAKAISFLIILTVLIVINAMTSSYWWVIWVGLGFAIYLAILAFELFVKERLFSGEWEKRIVEKRLGRKL